MFITYNDKDYSVQEIGCDYPVRVYSYANTFVKDGYIYNVFSVRSSWCGDCTKLHKKIKMRSTWYGCRINAQDESVAIDSSCVEQLTIKTDILGCVPIGALVTIGKMQFVKIRDEANGTLLLTEKIMNKSPFGESNDFGRSLALECLKICVLPKIEKAVGAENMMTFTTDLHSFDNPNQYMDIDGKISLLSYKTYDSMERTINRYAHKDNWWLCTAYERGHVLCVRGDRESYNSPKASYGLRPIVMLKSDMIVTYKG